MHTQNDTVALKQITCWVQIFYGYVFQARINAVLCVKKKKKEKKKSTFHITYGPKQSYADCDYKPYTLLSDYPGSKVDLGVSHLT